ncbi:Uncharacterised protein [Vibrio cholerae]|nr:Uncharacterised protein [Vibrio cholerae]CSI76291.1 Uncharacterised protein [Vibrio cholerae]
MSQFTIALLLIIGSTAGLDHVDDRWSLCKECRNAQRFLANLLLLRMFDVHKPCGNQK